ncbi:MAG: hypothetical protein WC708_13730 [Lentisphaeria bacterium]
MAQKTTHPRKLSFTEIVMGADAEVIRSAYEARVKIDGLLAEREAAYRKILELETQVETVIGEEGVFVYPPPPAPVAGIPKLEPASRRTEPAVPAHPADGSAAPAPAAAKAAAARKGAAAEKLAGDKAGHGSGPEDEAGNEDAAAKD